MFRLYYIRMSFVCVLQRSQYCIVTWNEYMELSLSSEIAAILYTI